MRCVVATAIVSLKKVGQIWPIFCVARQQSMIWSKIFCNDGDYNSTSTQYHCVIDRL